jgi:hypothetical protein
MVRVVCDPEGVIHVDRYLKAPGRGAHVCYSAECLTAAVERRAFGRAFKRAIKPLTAAELIGAVLAAVNGRMIDALALARRAGQTRAGTDVLERGMDAVGLLLFASDVAPATRSRLERLATARDCPVVDFPGDRSELGHLLGKPQRVAVGIVDFKAAAAVRRELARRTRLLVAAKGE